MSATLKTRKKPANKAQIVNIYAHNANKAFQPSPGQYMTLAARLAACFGERGPQLMLDKAKRDFKANNPTVQKWKDLPMCRAASATLDQVLIDTTQQREVEIDWVCKVLKDFRSEQVAPLLVWEDPNQPNKYISWDGQHTSLVLWTIAVEILKLDPSKCRVPVAIYPITNRADIRCNFNAHNGPGKRGISKPEAHRQEVLAVRDDGSTNVLWMESAAKQTILENYQLFVCDNLHLYADKAGAITNMSEFLATGKAGPGKRYEFQDLENFCKLFTLGTQWTRPVQSKEMWQFMEYFRMCRHAKVKVDSVYVQDMVACIVACFGSLDGEKIFRKGKQAYEQWYRGSNNGEYYNRNWKGTNLKDYHLTWLCAVLAEHSTLEVPDMAQKTNLWKPLAKCLEISYLKA